MSARTEEYLDQFSELLLARESCGICEYQLTGKPAASLARAMIEGLPENRQLAFYDPFYPSPSDAGAYVQVRRLQDRYLYAFGNHGWSEPWTRQSKEFLIQYLALCLPAHQQGATRETIRLTPVLLEDVVRSFKDY